MRSKTVGSATAGQNTGSATADYTTIALWQGSILDTDDETATIITSVADVETSNLVLSTTNTGHTYKITADSSTYVNAPTHAAASAKAHMSGRLSFTVGGWVCEKFSIIPGSNDCMYVSSTTTVRRMVVIPSGAGKYGVVWFQNASGTATLSNMVAIAGAGLGFGCIHSSGTMNVYHSSAISSGSGTCFTRTAGTLATYACVAQGAGTGFTGTNGGTDCASFGSAGGCVTWGGQTDAFVLNTAGSENLALADWAQNRYGSADYTASASGDPATDFVGVARVSPFNAGVSQHTTDLSSTLLTNLLCYYPLSEAAAAGSATRAHNYYCVDTASDTKLTDHNTVTQEAGLAEPHSAGFTAASSMYLDTPLTCASLRRGNAVLSGGLRIYLPDKSANYGFVEQQATSGVIDYEVYYLTSDDKFHIGISDVLGGQSVAVTGTPTAGAWHYVGFKYDTSNKTIYGVMNPTAGFSWSSQSSANAKDANADGMLVVGRVNNPIYSNSRIEGFWLSSDLRADQDHVDHCNGVAGIAWPLTRPASGTAGTITSMLSLMGVG